MKDTLRTLTIVISLAANLLLGLGCAEFVAVGSGQRFDLKSLGRGPQLGLDSSLGAPKKNSPLRVYGDISGYPEGTQFFWDHQFEDGSIYCEQTTELNKGAAVFACPVEGTLVVVLYVILQSGEETAGTLEVYIGGDGNSGPVQPEEPPPVADPGPQGGALYQQFCGGCHGPLDRSNKRNRTLNQLNQAISNEPQMRFLNVLTTEQRSAIVKALQ